jgi:hypothetical protein
MWGGGGGRQAGAGRAPQSEMKSSFFVLFRGVIGWRDERCVCKFQDVFLTWVNFGSRRECPRLQRG